MLTEPTITFPVEKDPFHEAECTKDFALAAMDGWVRTRTNFRVPHLERARKAHAFFHWFIAKDYVMDKDADGNPLRRATPEDEPYLIEHRLAWLAPGVRIAPMETLSPKRAVEVAYADFTAALARDKAERELAAKNAKDAERANPPKQRF